MHLRDTVGLGHQPDVQHVPIAALVAPSATGHVTDIAVGGACEAEARDRGYRVALLTLAARARAVTRLASIAALATLSVLSQIPTRETLLALRFVGA